MTRMEEALGPNNTHTVKALPPTSWHLTTVFIKDTWTKPRGRVEVGEGSGFSWGGVEGWGEKAYNCN